MFSPNFFLSGIDGVDPAKEIYNLGKELSFTPPDRLIDISLGQGQGALGLALGVKAERAIALAAKK
eukprot:476658-Amorphochlora_amoeboformis.AAC.1